MTDAVSLQLTRGMTLEAWVNPRRVSGAWRDVIYKGNDNYYLEGTSTNSSRPALGGTYGRVWRSLWARALLATNTWTYLAGTYDGGTMRLYVNGVQVASRAQTGAIATSTNPLQMGGDSIYGQYFAGIIDEVRIYNRALSVAEILADMNTPVGGSSATGSDDRRYSQSIDDREHPNASNPVHGCRRGHAGGQADGEREFE